MVFETDWKVISTAPHFNRKEPETRAPSTDIGLASLSGPLSEVHNHIAGIERALYDEVERRITSENQFREQLETKIRITTERLSDVTETEMARMYRRIEADVMNRLESLTIEVRKMSSTVTKLSRQVDSVSSESQENRGRVLKLEKRLGLLIDSSEGQSSSLPKDPTNLREYARNEVEMARRVSDLTDLVSGRVSSRIDAIEEWLQGNLTPEILRITDAIKAEQLTREDHDGEIMDVVRQYTEIMRKHFDSEAVTNEIRRSEIERPKAELSPEVAYGVAGRPAHLQSAVAEKRSSQASSAKDKSAHNSRSSRRSSVNELAGESHHSSEWEIARSRNSVRAETSNAPVVSHSLSDIGSEGRPQQPPPAEAMDVRGSLRRGGRLELNDVIDETN